MKQKIRCSIRCGHMVAPRITVTEATSVFYPNLWDLVAWSFYIFT